MPITLAARQNFVQQSTRLSVWLARRLASSALPFRQVLTTRTNLYRFTALWDGQHHPAEPLPGWRDPQWESLLDQLDRIDAKYPAGDAPPALETEILALLWPLMAPRVARDVAAWPTPASKPFGFFGYKPGDEGWAHGTVTLHLNNPFAPASPFDDLPARARELARLLHHTRTQQPDLHTVSCTSWISSVATFQSLFPGEFAASASPPKPLAYHLGWWGQFIDRTGDFHQRNARHLRTTGQFRFPCLTCACPLATAFTHLHDHFAIAAQ